VPTLLATNLTTGLAATHAYMLQTDVEQGQKSILLATVAASFSLLARSSTAGIGTVCAELAKAMISNTFDAYSSSDL